MNRSNTVNKLRDLNYTESLHTLACEELDGAFSVVYAIKINQLFQEPVLKDALRKVVLMSQSLRLNIVKTNDGYFFVENKPQIEKNIEFINEKLTQNNILKIIQHYSDQKIDYKDKCWELKVFSDIDQKSSLLVFKSHHTITDGLQVFDLFKELLNNYSNLKNDYKYQTEELFNHNVQDNFSVEVTELKDNAILSFENNIFAHQLISKIISFSIENSTINNIIKYCKTENISINDYICSCTVVAAENIFNDKKDKVTINIPYNLRKLTNISCDNYFCGGISISYDSQNASKSFVKNAKITSQEVKSQTNNKKLIKPHSNDYIAAKMTWDRLKSDFKNHRLPYEFSISNLGKISLGSQFDELIEGVYCSSGRKACDQTMLITPITIAQKMFFTIAYPDPAIDSKTATLFAAKLKKVISDKCNL